MMTPERRRHLENSWDNVTDEEFQQGYHFCKEWDFMLVGPEDAEAQCCICTREDGSRLCPLKDSSETVTE
jgi:hypothetical protein